MGKFCTNCGNEIKEDVSFCVNCGKKINDNKENTKESDRERNRPRVEITNQKSKVAAGLFGIFLGALGIHNFYLGYTNKGVAQLLITVLTCGALSFVSATWGLIEGILILTGSINTDSEGNPLGQ